MQSKIERAKDYGKDARSSIVLAINEYNSLVYSRSKEVISSNRVETSATNSVESVLSKFADSAVDTTYSLVWNPVGLPFSIKNTDSPDDDMSELAELLTDKITEQKTQFKRCIRFALKCFLEYGNGWMYVFDDDGVLQHRVFSAKEISRSLDLYMKPEYIYLDRGNQAYTFIEREDKRYRVHQKNHGDNTILSSGSIEYCPIQELALAVKYDDKYSWGYGLRSISTLKRYDNIVNVLAESAQRSMNPIKFTNSQIHKENSAENIFSPNRRSPIIVDNMLSGSSSPIGYIPEPISSADAWNIFNLSATELRESFNFINRLMTIKDDASMTATEAQIRSSSDAAQVRDIIESVFSFLSEVHRVQLHILLAKDKDFKKFKAINPNKLNFFHTSIFKKEHEQSVLSNVNFGLDMISKIASIAIQMGQSGVENPIDVQKLISRVGDITDVSLKSQQVQTANLFSRMLDIATSQAEGNAN